MTTRPPYGTETPTMPDPDPDALAVAHRDGDHHSDYRPPTCPDCHPETETPCPR